HLTYDSAGNMAKRQGQWGAVNDSINVTYDDLNRPAMWENTGAGDVPFARSWYRYDKLGREVATWRDEQSGKGERYNYDIAGHLGTAVYNADQVWTGSPQNWDSRRDYYRGPGYLNWTWMNDNGSMAPLESNALNQYTNVGGQALGYDGNFNLTNYQGATFSYNANNQVMRADKSGNIVQFVYDGLGRAVKQIVNGSQTLF